MGGSPSCRAVGPGRVRKAASQAAAAPLTLGDRRLPHPLIGASAESKAHNALSSGGSFQGRRRRRWGGSRGTSGSQNRLLVPGPGEFQSIENQGVTTSEVFLALTLEPSYSGKQGPVLF